MHHRPFFTPNAAYSWDNPLVVNPTTRYLLLDRFLVNDDTPVASPRNCEPGPGQLTFIDVGGKFSVSGGKLNLVGGTGTWNQTGFFSTATIARVAGRIMALKYQASGAPDSLMLGCSSVGNADFAGFNNLGLQLEVGFDLHARYATSGASPQVATLTIGVEYDLATVLQAAGRFHFLRTVGNPWSLLWWDGAGKGGATTTPVYLAAAQRATGAATFDDCRVLERLWTPAAMLDVASPTIAAPYDGAGDLLADVDMTWTTGETRGLSYRYADANNRWRVYVHTDGKLKLDSTIAGVTVNRFTSAAAVWTTGTTRTLRVIAVGATHMVFAFDGATWTRHANLTAMPATLDGNATLWLDDGAMPTGLSKLVVYRRAWVDAPM